MDTPPSGNDRDATSWAVLLDHRVYGRPTCPRVCGVRAYGACQCLHHQRSRGIRSGSLRTAQRASGSEGFSLDTSLRTMLPDCGT